MTTEPRSTLDRILAVERFAIEATSHLGPFGEEVDRLCYHLHVDLHDETRHDDPEEVLSALHELGVEMKLDALADYPWEVWETRWPTNDWLENILPKIFDVMNRFGHGVYAVSYEPKGPAKGIYQAAFNAAWERADPNTRPDGCEQEDLTEKAASVVFHVKFYETVYTHIEQGQLSVNDAIARINSLGREFKQRWPNKKGEVASLFKIRTPEGLALIPKFGSEHQELLDWALWHITTSPEGKSN